jgi:hypothetical protein
MGKWPKNTAKNPKNKKLGLQLSGTVHAARPWSSPTMAGEGWSYPEKTIG